MNIKAAIVFFIFLAILPGQVQDSVLVKYFRTDLTRTAVLKKALSYEKVKGKPYFRAEYTPAGELIKVEFITDEYETEKVATYPGLERKPFVPLSPEEQAAMNPDNKNMQQALGWTKPRSKRKIAEKTEKMPAGVISDEEQIASDSTSGSEQSSTPKTGLTVLQMEVLDPVKKADIIRGAIRQRIITAEPGGVRYFRRWKVSSGELSEPIPATTTGRFYKAQFDDKGVLNRVTFYNQKGQRSWSYLLERDSTGIYQSYSIKFHRHLPLMVLDKHLFAPDVSEMRPGWSARYKIFNNGRPKSVSVYDEHDNFFYYYLFSYQIVGQSDNFHTIVTSEYYHADSSRVGSHKLFFKSGSALDKIEFFNSRGELLRTEEYHYDQETQEVMLTISNRKGKVMQRRLLPGGSNR